MKKLFSISVYFLVPVVCLCQQINLDSTNFKIYNEIYSVLKERYPLFKCRYYYNLDSAYNRYKPDVLKSTNEKELGLYSCKMIAGLEDFHTRIFNNNGGCYALPQNPDWLQLFHNDSLQRIFWDNSDKTLFKYGFSQVKNNFSDEDLPMIRYSKSADIGYLNVTRFTFKLEDEGFLQKDSLQLAILMDTLVQYFKSSKALIIDLRSCMGGWPAYGEIIASRLTKERKVYSREVIFKSAKDSLAPVDRYISPAGQHQINLPIIILTNKVARSSSEYFILMLKQLSDVYIIGEPTWGAFASNEEYKLSNGWILQYSVGKLYSANGDLYEGKGIPVDFKINNTWEDIVTHNDKVLKEAFLYIDKRNFGTKRYTLINSKRKK